MSKIEQISKLKRRKHPLGDDRSLLNAVTESARGKLVRQYRKSPGIWPDGIDSAGDRWYRPEEWNDDGVRIAGKPYDGTPRAADDPADEPVTKFGPDPVTKVACNETPDDPVTKLGRPARGDGAMTSAERVREWRRKKAEAGSAP
jgi:hypothetical protein